MAESTPDIPDPATAGDTSTASNSMLDLVLDPVVEVEDDGKALAPQLTSPTSVREQPTDAEQIEPVRVASVITTTLDTTREHFMQWLGDALQRISQQTLTHVPRPGSPFHDPKILAGQLAPRVNKREVEVLSDGQVASTFRLLELSPQRLKVEIRASARSHGRLAYALLLQHLSWDFKEAGDLPAQALPPDWMARLWPEHHQELSKRTQLLTSSSIKTPGTTEPTMTVDASQPNLAESLALHSHPQALLDLQEYRAHQRQASSRNTSYPPFSITLTEELDVFSAWLHPLVQMWKTCLYTLPDEFQRPARWRQFETPNGLDWVFEMACLNDNEEHIRSADCFRVQASKDESGLDIQVSFVGAKDTDGLYFALINFIGDRWLSVKRTAQAYCRHHEPPIVLSDPPTNQLARAERGTGKKASASSEYAPYATRLANGEKPKSVYQNWLKDTNRSNPTNSDRKSFKQGLKRCGWNVDLGKDTASLIGDEH